MCHIDQYHMIPLNSLVDLDSKIYHNPNFLAMRVLIWKISRLSNRLYSGSVVTNNQRSQWQLHSGNLWCLMMATERKIYISMLSQFQVFCPNSVHILSNIQVVLLRTLSWEYWRVVITPCATNLHESSPSSPGRWCAKDDLTNTILGF